MSEEKKLARSLERITILILFLIICLVASCLIHYGLLINWKTFYPQQSLASIQNTSSSHTNSSEPVWRAPDMELLPYTAEGDQIRYGRELIEHTAVYLGPKGKVAAVSNGMNCQNCHLHGGTKPFGNNYGAVATKYPTYRSRSGEVEGFERRVNDCIQRSLNGQGLDTAGREMKAIVAYLKWIGKDVRKGEKPKGFGLVSLSLLDRPADPAKGEKAYRTFCSRCHGENGEGRLTTDGNEWKYPPLWGEHSYNTGAGLYRISKFASFIKSNMPFGISYDAPLLTDEEAWDIAAYVNSMPRPHKDFAGDWPDLSKKPMDHPFGPYADNFSERDHKYGPYQAMMKEQGK